VCAQLARAALAAFTFGCGPELIQLRFKSCGSVSAFVHEILTKRLCSLSGELSLSGRDAAANDFKTTLGYALFAVFADILGV
jgi:hypothetical protein